MIEIKALSIRQPFASWLLASGHPLLKTIENRSFKTNHRGKLYIHASRLEKKPTGPEYKHLAWIWDECPGEMQCGAIIGSVDVADCAGQRDVEECYWKLAGRSQRTLTERQQELLKILPTAQQIGDGRKPAVWDWWAGEAFAWLFQNPQTLAAPILTGGKLQLWKYHAFPEQLEIQK